MAIDGIQAFAKCAACGTVMWTEVRLDPAEKDQACICRCGETKIVNTTVTGNSDPAFEPTTLEALVAAEEAS